MFVLLSFKSFMINRLVTTVVDTKLELLLKIPENFTMLSADNYKKLDEIVLN